MRHKEDGWRENGGKVDERGWSRSQSGRKGVGE